MQTNASKLKLYLIVILVSAASLPVSPTAAVAIAIDCGETSLAMTPPAVFAETNKDGSVPIIWPAVAWIGANNVLLLTTEPVINTPIQPKIGDSSGNTPPVVATASPSAAVKPP